MKAKIYTLCILILLGLLAIRYDTLQHPTSTTPSVIPDPAIVAPNFIFRTADQKIHHLYDLPEQGIILHFWASWCAPCLTEMPALLEQLNQAQGKLTLLAVSIDDDQAAMKNAISHFHTNNKNMIYWIWDQNKAISLNTFNTVDVPETILIDAHRQMIEKLVGDPDWKSAKSANRLTALAK